MSPPDTNIKKQGRRHRSVLYIVAMAIVIFVIGGLLLTQTPLVPEEDTQNATEVEGN